MPLYLTYSDVEAILSMEECIRVVEEAFKISEGVWSPPRSILRLPEDKSVWLFMPTYTTLHNLLAIKIVSEHEYNPVRYNLPKQSGEVILHNPVNGQLLAIIDATIITMLRTGAMCGVATKYMAREDSSRAALIGSGIQARGQLMALCAVRKIEDVKVYSPTKRHREEFASKMSEKLSIRVTPVESAKEAVEDVDIVVTATNSPTPVLSGDWIKPGMHINSIGTLPERKELDLLTIKKADVIVVDRKQSVFNEAGDIMEALRQNVIVGDNVLELSDIVLGRAKGRRRQEDITLFKCVGFALLDLVTALKVYDLALQKKVGLDLQPLLTLHSIAS